MPAEGAAEAVRLSPRLPADSDVELPSLSSDPPGFAPACDDGHERGVSPELCRGRGAATAGLKKAIPLSHVLF